MSRYPYTCGLLLTIAEIGCMAWLISHDACMHPIGNSVASLIGFVLIPMLAVHLTECRASSR